MKKSQKRSVNKIKQYEAQSEMLIVVNLIAFFSAMVLGTNDSFAYFILTLTVLFNVLFISLE